jgi:exonuclease III
MNTNLSINSWNVNGLGDKCKDDLFLSCMKYDINILLETWKGTDANFNIPDFKILQKCRKKQRRSKRFSGGIVILYKSKLHKGIYELQDMSTSKNRIWLKGILSTSCVIFPYTKLLSISVLTFIK